MTSTLNPFNYIHLNPFFKIHVSKCSNLGNHLQALEHWKGNKRQYGGERKRNLIVQL